MDLVSAIIITHNRKELVFKAIDSVKKQDYEMIELIVVDDASEDDVRAVLEAEAVNRAYKYIYIPKSESKGGNHARNVGIDNANGSYIAFLDDDDEWMPKKISKQMEYISTHPETELVHCGKVYEYNYERTEKTDLNQLLEGDLSKKVWECVPFTTSCLLVKKSVFSVTGKFDEELRFWQEYEFAMRACQKYPIGVVRDHLVLYRVITSDGNRLTNKIKGWEDAVAYIKKKHASVIGALTPEEQKSFQLRIYADGALRATNCGDKKQKREFLYQAFKLKPSLKSFARLVLNKDKLRKGQTQ